MRFLRIRRRRAVGARGVWKIAVAEPLADLLAHRSDGFLAKLHTVGTHIGDQACGLAADIDAFIKPLRNLHCPACRETELSGRFLLKRRGGERRLRVFPNALCLDVGYLQALGLDGRGCRNGLCFRADVQLA